MNANEIIDRFMELFRSNSGYVKYDVDKIKKEKNKVNVNYVYNNFDEKTARSIYANHLYDGIGIGVCPFFNNEYIFFCCVDVDQYDLDIVELDKNIIRLELPFLICRSKSGGYHLFVFFTKATKMILPIRETCKEWIRELNIDINKCEFFPKQLKLKNDEKGSTINLPYPSEQRDKQYCYSNGKILNIEEFLQLANKIRVNPDNILNGKIDKERNEVIEKVSLDNDYDDAPPCLKYLLARKIKEGERNRVLFNIGIFLKKKFPDTWKDKLSFANFTYCANPVKYAELTQSVIKSLDKKNYVYQCSDIVLSSCCNKNECFSCPYGINTFYSNDYGKTNTANITDFEMVRPETTINDSKDSVMWKFNYHCENGEIITIKIDSPEILNDGKKISYAIQAQTGEYFMVTTKEWQNYLQLLFKDIKVTKLKGSLDVAKNEFVDVLKNFLLRKTSDTPFGMASGKIYKYKNENNEEKLGFDIIKFINYYNEFTKKKVSFNSIYLMLQDKPFNGKQKKYQLENVDASIDYIEVDSSCIEEKIKIKNANKKLDENI